MKSDRKKLKELRLLKAHLQEGKAASSSSLPADTFASRILLARLENEIQKLETKKYKPLKSKKRSKGSSFITILRLFLLDLPMTGLFAFAMFTVLIHQYYMKYISPTIDAANWIDNDQERLLHEFTYYSRECDESDVTTSSLDTVVLDPSRHTAKDAVDNLMHHGMTYFPSLLDKNVSLALRTYIMKRNQELTNDEFIPLDTPRGRWSFGIHATEDPSVSDALEQLASNELLENALVKILGGDASVAEITAITVAPGAKAQGWHSDVKQLGNSVKYAQTFTHSYSLFIPLQDVSASMGATELCPGTHYCADEDLWDVCVNRGFQAAGDGPGELWNTGDGLMMNQKMWHRGGEYVARNGLHRVVFIITFISKPDFGRDSRQLSHGTYFHIHPHMYGFTFKDLKNAHLTMSWPFAPLRSLGIWKPPTANWGWDFISSTATRIANDQNGYQVGDLYGFVEDHSIGQMIPEWLHGPITESGGWQLYFKETTKNFTIFSVALYTLVFCVMFGLILLTDFIQNFEAGRTKTFIKRSLLFNSIVLLICYKAVLIVEETQFAKSVNNKTIFFRPFLEKPQGSLYKFDAKKQVQFLNTEMMGVEPSVPRLTTIPSKTDILLGNRFDNFNIGYYINFLDYHPANMKWRSMIDAQSKLYHSYRGLPKSFSEQLQIDVESFAKRSGRMLTQNYFGEWVIMNSDEVQSVVQKGLLFGIDSLGATLDKTIAVLESNARHGILFRQKQSIQRQSLSYLKRLRKALGIIPKQSEKKSINVDVRQEKSWKHFGSSNVMPDLPNSQKKLTRSMRKITPNTITNAIQVGDVRMSNYRGSGYYLPGKIIHKEYEKYGIIEFFLDQGEYAHGGGERSGVHLPATKPFRGVQEGDEIAVLNRKCPKCSIEFEYGTVLRCYPDLSCDVVYGENKMMENLHKDDFGIKL